MMLLGLMVAGLFAPASARAEPAHAGLPTRTVVELFTSQGCSSCPPADRLLGDLAADPSIVALSLPVDYWDYLGWKDTLASPRFTARQRAYSRARGDRDVYTPQMIVNGRVQVVGNDRARIEKAIGEARLGDDAVPVTLSLAKDRLKVAVGQAKAASASEVWICALTRQIAVSIGRGENRDRQVVYHNVVRRWHKIDNWNGATANWDVPLESIRSEGVDAAVVFIQRGSLDAPGPMLGAAYVELN
ncbi:MAG: DUF1223 domain-containing protein [Xanthobacteraceae bacterium]|nr:MAG: DUF1223 domain-containing protein [Xanthobacteraceae bacterium]